MCFIFPFRSYADPFEWAPFALTPHYRRCSSTVNQSDCRFGLPFPYLCSACPRLLSNSNRLSQVPSLTLLVARRGLRPRHVFPYSPFFFFSCARFFSGFRYMKTLAFVHHSLFRGSIPSLALRLTSSLSPASLDSSPHLVWSLVLSWWLAFAHVGFPTRLSTASLGALIVRF